MEAVSGGTSAHNDATSTPASDASDDATPASSAEESLSDVTPYATDARADNTDDAYIVGKFGMPYNRHGQVLHTSTMLHRHTIVDEVVAAITSVLDKAPLSFAHPVMPMIPLALWAHVGQAGDLWSCDAEHAFEVLTSPVYHTAFFREVLHRLPAHAQLLVVPMQLGSQHTVFATTFRRGHACCGCAPACTVAKRAGWEQAFHTVKRQQPHSHPQPLQPFGEAESHAQDAVGRGREAPIVRVAIGTATLPAQGTENTEEHPTMWLCVDTAFSARIAAVRAQERVQPPASATGLHGSPSAQPTWQDAADAHRSTRSELERLRRELASSQRRRYYVRRELEQ